MADELDTLLESLHAEGYDSITRIEDFPDEAEGIVPISKKHRRNQKTGWRRFIPRLENGANPEFVPDDLRAIVEEYEWTVQAMGRKDQTVHVVISENGV